MGVIQYAIFYEIVQINYNKDENDADDDYDDNNDYDDHAYNYDGKCILLIVLNKYIK